MKTKMTDSEIKEACLPKEIKKQYSDIIMSISLDYQMGKINWDHYIYCLDITLDNINHESEVRRKFLENENSKRFSKKSIL
jgi:hypothetical protein